MWERMDNESTVRRNINKHVDNISNKEEEGIADILQKKNLSMKRFGGSGVTLDRTFCSKKFR